MINPRTAKKLRKVFSTEERVYTQGQIKINMKYIPIYQGISDG